MGRKMGVLVWIIVLRVVNNDSSPALPFKFHNQYRYYS